MRARATVAIIGSGATGLSTAYSLVRRGVKDIVILERGHLASGASSRNGGGVRAQFSTEENIALARWSIARFRELGKELGVNFWFRQTGYLFIAESEEELRALSRAVELHRRFRLGTKMVDSNQIHDIVPALSLEGVIGGAFRKGDGILFPFPLLFGLAERLREVGVAIHTHCEVTGIARSRERFLVETSKGQVEADKVLNAAGAWSYAVGRMMGVDLPTRRVRHQIMASEPLAPFLDPMVVTVKDGFYVSQSQRGELVGGISEAQPHGDDQSRSSSEFCRRFSSRLVRMFPRLSAAKMMRQWAGYYDMSPDANPILDEVPGLEGAFVACGFSGHGFMISPAVGEFMASMILGERPMFPRKPYGLDRFLGNVGRGESFVIG